MPSFSTIYFFFTLNIYICFILLSSHDKYFHFIGTGDSGFNTAPSEKVNEDQSENVDTAAITTNSHSHASPPSPPPSSLTTPAAASHISATTATTNPVPGRGPTSSQDLNTSFATSNEDRASLYHPAPAYRAVTPIPGLLGLRMGSPAYEKYLQLKERQRRLKAAQAGEQVDSGGVGYGGRMSAPHLMPPPSGMWRGDMMDYMTDARSMASLMSYSLGEGHCSGVFLYETHFSVMSSLSAVIWPVRKQARSNAWTLSFFSNAAECLFLRWP